MVKILAMAALAFGLCGTDGPHVWTLEECLSYALTHNPQMRQAGISVRKCKTEAAASLSDWLPQISVYVGNDYSWGRSVDMQELMIVNNRLNYTASVSAVAEVSLTGLVSNAVSHKDLRLATSESEAEMQAAASSLTSEVTSAYFQLLLSEEACRCAQSEYDELLLKRQLIREEMAAGLKSRIELARMESRVAEEKAALTESSNTVKMNRMALISHLNLPPEEDFDILPPTGDSICQPYGFEAAIAGRISDMPDVRRAEISLERAKAGKAAAKLAFLPEVAVTFGYGTYYGNTSQLPLRKQLSSNHNPTVEIGLTIPLTGLFGKSRSLKTAALSVADREVEVEKMRASQNRAVFNDISQASGLYWNYLAAKENLAAAEAEYALNSLKMNDGEISWSEYLLSRNSKMRAEAALIQAKYRYLMKIKEIEFRYGL